MTGTASDYKNVNFGPKLLMASAAEAFYSVAMYNNSSDIDNGAYPGVDSDGLVYVAATQGGSDWAIYSYDPTSAPETLTEVAVLNSHSFIGQIKVDTSGNIFLMDTGNEKLTMLNSAGTVQWGPKNLVMDSSYASEQFRKIATIGTQLFLCGEESNNGNFLVSPNVSSPTTNIYGAALCLHDTTNGGQPPNVPSLVGDSVNDQVLYTHMSDTNSNYMGYRIYDKDQTGTTIVADGQVGGWAGNAFWSSPNGNFSHYDSKNDRYIILMQDATTGVIAICAIPVTGGSVSSYGSCSTLGTLLDSTMDADGNIYILISGYEIVKLDDTFSPVWQSSVSTVDTTILINSITYSSKGCLVASVEIDLPVNNDYVVWWAIPAGTGTCSITLSDPDDAPNTITASGMTADTWGTSHVVSHSALVALPQDSTAVDLDDDANAAAGSVTISYEYEVS